MTATAADPLAATPGTVPALLAAISHRPTPAMRFKRDGRWSSLSYQALHARASDVARGLIALGVRPGERVAVIGQTTPDWTLCDLGVLCAGAVTVPVYHTNSPKECQYVVEHSGARAIFCEDASQLAKIREIREACPDLEHVIVMDPAAADAEDAMTLDALCARREAVGPDALAAATSHVQPGDLATIVYTSGTTGPPKGCMLTHHNLLSTAEMYQDVLLMVGDERPVVFMFLPLAHVLARVVQFVTFQVGGELAFWTGDSANLLSDLAEIRPTHFPSVPRVYEKVRTAALAGIEETNPVKRLIFEQALRAGARQRQFERAGMSPDLLHRVRYAAAQRLVFDKVHGLFGGNLRRALTGAAPLGREVLDFFDAVGITIYEGYGMTETTAAATLNIPGAYRPGTVGRPLAGVDVAIAEDGEILMRGPNISPGYLHNEEATAELFTEEGWLRSGDLGEIDSDGFLAIKGRKKDLIITSSGKNITPANIETELQETRWISHAVVFGDNKPYLVALLTLDPDQLEALAEHAGTSVSDAGTMGTDPAVRKLLAEAVSGVNAHYANIEQIKRFAVLDHDLSEERGELTPTMKVKRALVNERYRDEFEALYQG